MIMRSNVFNGALVYSARTETAVSVARPTIHALLELTPEQLERRATARAHALRVRALPRWHVAKAAAIGFLDYIVGLLLVAAAAWLAGRLVVGARGLPEGAAATNANDALADWVRLGVTVLGWLAVTVYSLKLASRRAFVGFHDRTMNRLASFISLFEILRIINGPSIVNAVAGNVSAGGTPGWLYALAELPLHPYVLAGCVIAMHLIVPRVMRHEQEVRSRAKSSELPATA